MKRLARASASEPGGRLKAALPPTGPEPQEPSQRRHQTGRSRLRPDPSSAPGAARRRKIPSGVTETERAQPLQRNAIGSTAGIREGAWAQWTFELHRTTGTAGDHPGRLGFRATGTATCRIVRAGDRYDPCPAPGAFTVLEACRRCSDLRSQNLAIQSYLPCRHTAHCLRQGVRTPEVNPPGAGFWVRIVPECGYIP